MSKEGPIAEPLQIGEMPKPRYLSQRPNTTGLGEEIKWIGIEAFGLDGQVKEFLFLDNYQFDGDLSDEQVRHKLATYIARLKLDKGADVAVGLPIDRGASRPQLEKVKIKEGTGLFGIYIESKHRPLFNFFLHKDGLISEEVLIATQPNAFRETYEKAKAVLPLPPRQ